MSARTPVTLVKMHLDQCARVWGETPCTATGRPCYNTWHTCRDREHYLKTSRPLVFLSDHKRFDPAAPGYIAGRPYIKSVKYLPTEIRRSLTVTGRVELQLLDEPDGDVGVDPYLDRRAAAPQGSYWKKLLARTPNYRGRLVEILEGFEGQAPEDYTMRWVGRIDNITLKDGSVSVKLVDLLQALDDIEAPAKADLKLVSEVGDADTALTLSASAGLEHSGYLRIGDEVIAYAALQESSRQVTGCTRGAFGTAPATHSVNTSVQPCRYFPPANPFDRLRSLLLEDGGIDPAHLDDAAWTYWRDRPGGEVPVSSLITKPTKLSKLYYELVDLVDCRSWVAEDQHITIRRNIPNDPTRSYALLTDDTHIIEESISVDLNASSRLTRGDLYWHPAILGDLEEPATYARHEQVVNASAERPESYGDVIETTIYCRWLHTGDVREELITGYARSCLSRQVWRLQDALPVLTLAVELKDAGIRTGADVRVITDALLDPAGAPIVRRGLVIKREPLGGRIKLTIELQPEGGVCFIAPDHAPAWSQADDRDREYGYIPGEHEYIIW